MKKCFPNQLVIGEAWALRLAVVAVLFTVFVSAAYADAPFTDIGVRLEGNTGRYIEWGDYDNDGDLDVLLKGSDVEHAPTIKIYRNDGGNRFTLVVSDLYHLGAQATGWGDYDGDGDLDILATGEIYRNDNGTFNRISTTLPDLYSSAASWGDYDNDGDLDAVMSGFTLPCFFGCPESRVYRNDGHGTFTGITLPDPVWGGSLAWGDYDNDMDLDILLSGRKYVEDVDYGPVSRVYRNDAGSFHDAGVPLVGLYYSSGTWGDYDNDGDLDILMGGRDSEDDNLVKIYRNTAGSFVDIEALLVGNEWFSLRWGDYDNDGDLDILQPNSPYTRIYRNDNGDFQDIGPGLAGVVHGAAAWGDYDNDGDLDILLAGRDGNWNTFSGIYRNNIGTSNTAPSSPSDLHATAASSSEVLLSWLPASDGQTPVSGLTYNVRVGTFPGGTDILAPMAATDTGYRRIPALGNAQHGTTAILKRDFGTRIYYWSVQAVDTAFAGSPFAAEGIFSTDTQAPTGSFAINHGAIQTEAVTVHLDIDASDPEGNAIDMRLRNNNDPWGAWQPYQPWLTWQLPAINNQTHTVHMQVRDQALNMADVVPQAILLSFYPPRPASANARLAASAWGSGALKSSPGYCLEDSTLEAFSPGLLASPAYRWYSGFWGALRPQRVRGCGFDVNCDASFDVLDIQLAAQHWNTTLSPSCDRNAIYDLDGNLRVDVVDIQRVATHFAP